MYSTDSKGYISLLVENFQFFDFMAETWLTINPHVQRSWFPRSGGTETSAVKKGAKGSYFIFFMLRIDIDTFKGEVEESVSDREA